MDPATLGFIITLLLLPIYFGLREVGSNDGSSKSLEQAMKKLDAIESAQSDKYYCTVYETHLFDKKLFEAGVIQRKEITLCENDICELCKNERIWRSLDDRRRWERSEMEANPSEWENFQNLKKNDPRWKDYTYSDYKFQQKLKTANEVRQEISQIARVFEEGGRFYYIPEQVPDYAEKTMIESGYGPVEVVYGWYENGKYMAFRQPVSLEFRAPNYDKDVSPWKLRSRL